MWKVSFGSICFFMVYLKALRTLFLFVAQVDIVKWYYEQNTE